MHRIKTQYLLNHSRRSVFCVTERFLIIYNHNYKEKIDWFTIRIMKLRKKIKKFHTSVNSSRDDKRTHE